jgi:hypothetical protein
MAAAGDGRPPRGYRSRRMRCISLWLPMAKKFSSRALASGTKSNLSRRPHRHSKTPEPSLRNPIPACRCGSPHASSTEPRASPARLLSAGARFRRSRTRRSVSLICQEFFDVAGEAAEASGLAVFRDFFMSFGGQAGDIIRRRAVFAQGVIGRLHGDRPQGDDMFAVEDADILSFGGGFQPRGQIGAGFGRAERSHVAFIRRISVAVKTLTAAGSSGS